VSTLSISILMIQELFCWDLPSLDAGTVGRLPGTMTTSSPSREKRKPSEVHTEWGQQMFFFLQIICLHQGTPWNILILSCFFVFLIISRRFSNISSCSPSKYDRFPVKWPKSETFLTGKRVHLVSRTDSSRLRYQSICLVPFGASKVSR